MQLIIAEKPSVARDLARVLGVRPAGRHSFEGPDRVITWCVGHLVELEEPAAYDPAWKAWRLDTLPMLPPRLRLRAAAHARDQLREVTALLRDRGFAEVVNACDAGREGELIFRYVYEHAGSRLPVRRLWISSLTDEAIRRGMGGLRPGAQLDALGDAARCRSESDWLVGMNATRAVTARGRLAGHDALYSIGRVQTPTLAMLVERERAIEAFVPVAYWEVRGALVTATGERFAARWTAAPRVDDKGAPAARLATAALADAVVARDRARGAAADPEGPRVERVIAKTVREPPPLLFDLTSLQRTANRRFGLSAARTLELAQALYERHKLVTYPRTDSRHLSSDMVAELPALFAQLAELPAYAAFARVLVTAPPRIGKRIVDDTRVSDHHAIIPTGSPGGAARLAGLDRDHQRVFDLIVRRFLGAFYPDAELAQTVAWIRVGAPAASTPSTPSRGGPARGGEESPILEVLPPPPDRYIARGRVRVVAGWQEVAGLGEDRRGRAPDGDPDGDRDEPTGALPALVEGQALDGTFTAVEKATTPPPRFTEATLLGAMETAGKHMDDEALRAAMKDRGLGTPATRASIIETLLRRRYVERDKQALVPTAMGMGLVAALPVASLASAELTGTWEARLARIARGEESRAAFMADIARYVTEIVAAVRGAAPPPPQAPGGVPQQPVPTRGARGRGGGGGKRTWSRGGDERRPAAGASGSGATRARGSRAAAAAPARTAQGGAVGSTKRAAATTRGSTRPTEPVTIGQLACPRCQAGELITGARGWGCSRWRDGCGFVVWFETAGKRLTAAQLRDLVTRGRTRKARFSPDGTARAGHLVLDATRDGGAARFEPG